MRGVTVVGTYSIRISYDGADELMERYKQEQIKLLEKQIKLTKSNKILEFYEEELDYFNEATTEELLSKFLFEKLVFYKNDWN